MEMDMSNNFQKRNIRRKELFEIIKYIGVGVSGVFIDAVIYTILLNFAIPIVIAKGSGVLVGVIYGYFLNARWTFKGVINRTSILRYVLVYGSSIMINITINSTVIYIWGFSQLVLVAAFIAATFVSMVINFTGLKFWVFKK